jgi:dipeptidyl aminopeptidase/acylaminoacyl peptidase
MAGVPVGDYAMAYRDEAPSLQAMDRALFGGEPDANAEAFRRADPMTYADRVKSPVMFVVGEHDSRCPVDQALSYVEVMKRRGVEHELYLFSTGHGSHESDEEVRQHRAIDAFLRDRVPGLRPI